MGPPLLGAVKALVIAQALQGTIAGRVWDGGTADPVVGAVVTVSDLNRSARTDETGAYELRRVPPGQHEILVHLIGYAPRTFGALVPQDGPLRIDIWLPPEPVRIPVIDVPAPVAMRGPHASGTVAFPDREVSAAAMRNDPLLAEPDALGALAGGEVSVMQETPSGISIRGGGSDQTAYLLDGIPIINPYHSGGISSGWNPDVISSLRLLSAGHPTSPNALSGAVEGVTREPGNRANVEGSISTTQSRLTLSSPLGLGGAGCLVSLRSGLPDGIAPKGEPTYLRGETGDWLVKLEAPVLDGSLELLGYGNENDLNSAAVVPPEDGSVQDVPQNHFEWESRSMGAQWRGGFASTEVRVLGWRAAGDVGSVWAAPSGPLKMASSRRDGGLLLALRDHTQRASTDLQLRFERSWTSYRIASDSTTGPFWSLAGSTPVATAIARHTEGIGRRVELNLGGSVAMTGGRAHVGPSAQITWKPSETVGFSGSYARTHQFAQSLRNSESVVGNVFPVDIDAGTGLPGIPVAHSRLGVVAASYLPVAGLRIGAQAYERRSDGLLLVAPADGGPFATGAFLVGSGVSRGASIDAALSARRYGLVATYGFQRVRLTYGSAGYVPESGVAHLLRCGVIAFPNPSMSFRLGLTAALGRRATAVAGGFEWEADNILDRGSEFGGSPYEIRDALGAIRLPAYYRLDLGVRKQWQTLLLGHAGTVALFGTATNLFGRKNILTYAVDPSTGDRTGVEMRPRAPLVVGLDWGF